MSDDLVKRLRHIAMFNTPQDPRKGCMEAADRIEKLEKALNRIADLTERWNDSLDLQANEIARKALEGKEPLECTENHGQGSEPWLNKE